MSRFHKLPQRIRLTFEYEGVSGFLRKSGRFIVRLTPFGRRLNAPLYDDRVKAKRWYKSNWRPVSVIIPHYGDPEPTIAAVRAIRKTTDRKRVEVIVADDATPLQQHREQLEKACDAKVILGEPNLGFAGNVNRALDPIVERSEHDVVLMNNDVIAHKHWLEALQHGAYEYDRTGIVGPKLLYPDTSIQFAGAYRNIGAPEWFDHRFRFKPFDFGPANVTCPVLGVTGACMYIKRDVLDDVGSLDPNFPMAFEDADYCLRAWQQGYRSLYHPPSVLTHHESKTRGTDQGERELRSQRHFWDKWGDWFDHRPITTDDGHLRIVYVTAGTRIGGGHRVVFEHLNRLAELGHDVSLYSLEGDPDWFDLRVPVKRFKKYRQLARALAPLDAIKVATWWGTSQPVWLASIEHGIPVYFVQDIETSYYPTSKKGQYEVLANYKPEFHYLTTSSWNTEQLEGMGFDPTAIPPGADLSTFRPVNVEKRANILLTLGRGEYLKNLDLTVAAWKQLPEPRPELWMFGVEPEFGEMHGARYFETPSDEQVNELYNEAAVFVQTSRHEGFCLPILEAMSAGTPVVCTDAHGNRDFCQDGVNCLMPEATPQAVSRAIERVLGDRQLRDSVIAEGHKTATSLDWEGSVGPLEDFFYDIAARYRGNERAERKQREAVG